MMRFAWLLPACVACIAASASSAEWIAWTGAETHGTAGSEGWEQVPGGDQFDLLDWEVKGKANGYRYFYPGATHYTLGSNDSEKLVVNIWQPYAENSADSAVGANLRAALYTLYHRHLHRVVVNVSNVGWSSIVTDALCEDGAITSCPIAMVIGTSQLPQRVAADRILPLDEHFAAYLVKHLQRLPDEFQSLMYYDYQLNSRFMGVPFATDVRLLGFNVTTIQNLDLELPPPYGRSDWTWDNLRDMACAITEKHGVAGLVANSDWDEDAKLFMLMVQAEHGALFRLRHGSGGWSRQCDLGTGRSAIDSFWRPMISRGCLRASGNRNYWGISDNATLKPVLDKAVNPSHPPDVSSFSNYVYEDIPTFGLFISPGLDEELSVGRCRPEKPDASSGRVRRCHALETHNMSLAACRLRALRIGADTVMVDGEACELLKCLNAASALQYAQSKEVYSKHCSDILYATMPMNLTYQGGSGLAIPKHEGQETCSNVSDSSEWLENGEDPPTCWEHSEGWRFISELIDPDKPYMRQANTLKHVRTLPPYKDLAAFKTSFWEPVVAPLSQGIPSQYPNSPIPQYAEVEALKPIRIALLRSIYGNVSAAESLKEACGIVDEILRPCNQSDWESDPRCRNPRDGLQGCPAGTFYQNQEHFQDFGLGCAECPLGRFADVRSVDAECKPCASGWFSNSSGTTYCQQCALGTVAQQSGLSKCAECPVGFAPFHTHWCDPCPVATYQSGPTCQPCPSGFTSLEESTSPKACTRKMSVVVYNLLLILVLVCIALLLPLMLGRPIPIYDIYMEDGCVVVKTWGSHRMFGWSPFPLRVQLRGTFHPKVECKRGLFQARVRDADELWLLDSKGAHITESINTSRGSVRLLARSTCFGAAIAMLPVGLAAAGLYACLVIICWLLSENADAEMEAMPWVLLGIFLSLTLAMLAYWYWWVQSFETPLARKRKHWRHKLLRKQSAGACDRGPGRAISAGKLWEFHNYFQEAIGRRDMNYVVSNLLLPLTKPEKLSYAELAGPSQVQWFVSHCWNNCFADMMESLRRLATSLAEPGSTYLAWHEVSFWICSFSNNQYQLAEELGHGDPMASSFNQALLSPTCKGTAMVLDENAEALRRSWCLFEVFQTCKLTAERGDFEGLLMCTPSGVLQKGDASVDMVVVLARTLSRIRMEDASATRIEDKIMIDSCVQSLPGGFASVNRFVRHCVKAALDEAHGSFEGHFAALVSALEGNIVPTPSLLGRRSSSRLTGTDSTSKPAL